MKPHRWPDAIATDRNLTCLDCGCHVHGLNACRPCPGPEPVSQVGNHGEPFPDHATAAMLHKGST